MKLGGTHRFHDTANQEAKHRVSLKSNAEKIRVRSDTQTEQDLLRVTQEEIVFETVEGFLNEDMLVEDTPVTLAEEIAKYHGSSRDVTTDESVRLTSPLLIDQGVTEDKRDHLVHQEVLLSWGEVLDMFVHCFPDVAPVHEKAKWGVYQHCSHKVNGTNYHYWGTDNGYPSISRGGVRRRRDMVRVSLGGVHLAEMVCFVKALVPDDSRDEGVQFVGALVRWLTPHEYAVMQNGSPTCPGPLRHSHNLWAWHRTEVQRRAISGYRFGRLPQVHKTWLQPSSKRESLLFASYDVIELQCIGQYANVTNDFCTNGFLESVSWA